MSQSTEELRTNAFEPCVPERFMQLNGRTEDAHQAVLYSLPSAAVAGI